MALVVFQSWVCFCLSSQTLQSSTDFSSAITSSKASIITAWVSIGAWNHHHDSSVSRQNMPISSVLTERCLIEFIMPCGVSLSPKRFRAKARCPCDWRQASFSQYVRA